LKEEAINRSSKRTVVTLATFAFEVVLLNSFQNIKRKKRAFEEPSMVKGVRENPSKKEFLSPLARRPALFNRIRRAMWL